MTIPTDPKIYHIVHVNRLASIVAAGGLHADAAVASRGMPGTTIGMANIKQRRLTQNRLQSHPALFVGECVPFYFCPRSVMLYLIHRANDPQLAYKGGQVPIIHLEADLRRSVDWALASGKRWAFTLSNAGSSYFEDRNDLANLAEVNWPAVAARQWAGNGVSREVKEGKQAEFLLESFFPWHLVETIGVHSAATASLVGVAMAGAGHRPLVTTRVDWYY